MVINASHHAISVAYYIERVYIYILLRENIALNLISTRTLNLATYLSFVQCNGMGQSSHSHTCMQHAVLFRSLSLIISSGSLPSTYVMHEIIAHRIQMLDCLNFAVRCMCRTATRLILCGHSIDFAPKRNIISDDMLFHFVIVC